MEETKEHKQLFKLLQLSIYFSVCIELYLFYFVLHLQLNNSLTAALQPINQKFFKLPFYSTLINSKITTLCLISLVSLGTLSRKNIDLNAKRHILFPILAGINLIFFSVFAYHKKEVILFWQYNIFEGLYISCTLCGTILVHIALDNISKIIRSNWGRDRWNIEQESFLQPQKPVEKPYAVNIPMLFYHKRKVHKGYITLENLFRGLLLCGVPGSGKSFGIIMPIIRQMVNQSFTLCLYDLKYPDLGKIAYYHHLTLKRKGKCSNYKFHVINLHDPCMSRRVNPFKSEYINTLADASETAEALVEALKKGDKSTGSDQFFTQSAINFLAACIYFFSKYDNGKFSTLPHILSFLNLSYDEIFSVLFRNQELASLLSPFMTAYKAKAFDQLEGQVGTLKIFISRMATKETFWVFSGDDFNLNISSPNSPGLLVLANDPRTQSINSACLSTILNRVTKLINTKGNLPVGLIVDEAPSVYIHKIDILLAQARSNLSAVVIGVQELPMLRQQYGKETADTIISIMGNILSGAVRNKETLEWLERILGKVKQKGESISIDRNKTTVSYNEKLDYLIPSGKIASLSTGEIVGLTARDRIDKFTGQFQTTAIHCRVDLDQQELTKEESSYLDMPQYYDFGDKKEQILAENFTRITDQVKQMVSTILSSRA